MQQRTVEPIVGVLVPQGLEEIVKVMMFTPQARTGGPRLNRLWTHILHKSWRRPLAHPGCERLTGQVK